MNHPQLCARRLTVALVSAALALPGTAYAQVLVDGTELQEGTNDVGGGTADYCSGSLGMTDVTADNVWLNEDLAVSFNGGNSIDTLQVADGANVSVGFDGENDVSDIEVRGNSTVTIGMSSHNDFEDLEAYDGSSLTANVTGETNCEAIKGYDDANVTVQGTTCPRADVVTVGEGEHTERIGTERGDLVIRDVTAIMDPEEARISSREGDVSILCSKIEGGEDDDRTDIYAGGSLFVGGSVVDIAGTMSSDGQMTIRRSDIDVAKPDGDDSPYRVWSNTGIELVEELNGEVKDGKVDDKDVRYLATDGDPSEEVHLTSAVKPCYYTKCDANDSDAKSKLPVTGDASARILPATADTSAHALPLLALGIGAAFAGLKMRGKYYAAR